MEFPDLLDRFLKYVKIDTQSSETSDSYPSTKKQLDLAELLVKELNEIGMKDIELDSWGYVTATLPTNQACPVPTIALISHLDTSPDVSGKNVSPVIHKNYNGEDVVISRADNIILSVTDNPHLTEQKGKTLITADGTTLLGADDKAGIAEIMAALNYLTNNPNVPRPRIRVLFTPDEETGRGTEHIDVKKIDADFGYTVDGEKLGEVEDETFCADTVEIKITGINVHPGYAKNKLVNAIKVAASIIESLPGNTLSPETTEKREGYVHPHYFSGGSESVTIKILVRDFTEEGLKHHEKLLKTLADQAVARNTGAKIDFQVHESYRNMKIVLDQYPQVVSNAIRAVEMSGIKPIPNIIRGGTDGARLSFMGLPTPNLFTGGSNFHSRLEWVTLEDMQKSSEVIVNLMQIWADSGK